MPPAYLRTRTQILSVATISMKNTYQVGHAVSPYVDNSGWLLMPSPGGSGQIFFNDKLTFMMITKKGLFLEKSLVKTHDRLCKLLQTCRSLTEKIPQKRY